MKNQIAQTSLFGAALKTENRTVKMQDVLGLENLLPGNAGTSISVLGVLQDPLLHECEKGKYRVRAGEGRVSALHTKEIKEFTAKVIPFESNASPAALAAATIVTNVSRRRNPVAEGRSLAEAIRLYAEDKGAKVEEVRDEAITAFSAAYGVTPGQLESLYRITLLPPSVLDGYDAGNISPSVMERLAKKSEEFQLWAIKELEERGTLTGKVLNELQLAIDTDVSLKMSKAAPGMFGRVGGYLDNSAGPAGILKERIEVPGGDMGVSATKPGFAVAMPEGHVPFDAEATDAGRTIHVKGFELDNPALAEPFGGEPSDLLVLLQVMTHKARASLVPYRDFMPAFLNSLDIGCKDIVMAMVALWYLQEGGTVRRGRELLKDATAVKNHGAGANNFVLRVTTKGVQADANQE